MDSLCARARAIADNATRSDIECFCVQVDTDAGSAAHWYDTRQVSIGDDFPEDRAFIDEALEYLEARGLLIRREGAPHIVTFR